MYEKKDLIIDNKRKDSKINRIKIHSLKKKGFLIINENKFEFKKFNCRINETWLQ